MGNKRKKQNNNYSSYEDYEEMRGKGTKREKRKAQRHAHKSILKDVIHPEGIDYDELKHYLDDTSSN